MCHRTLSINLLFFLLIPLAIALTGGCRILQGDGLPTTEYIGSQSAGQPDDRTTDTDGGTGWIRAPDPEPVLAAPQQGGKGNPIRALLDSPDFAVTMQIKGGIGYFAGQTNELGRTLPVDPHRFLVLERLWLILDFTGEPQSIAIDFNGNEYNLAGVSGVTHYQTYLIIPEWPSTLTWDNVRLSPPLTLRVQAVARDNPDHQAGCLIEDIEITGDIYDITYAQPG